MTRYTRVMGGGGDAVPGGISGSQGGPSARILHCVVQSTIARKATRNASWTRVSSKTKKLKVFSCNNSLQSEIEY